jgi:outer membrane receptor protein involved in Fe transport
MDVPVSVSVLSGSSLESLNAQSLSDMADYIPGLSIENGGSPGHSQIVLRGISGGYNAGAALVATLIDDIPVGPSNGGGGAGFFTLDLAPYDLDHFEVLKGPQGTLYGATAMGGLVKYVLSKPDLNRFDAKLSGDVHYINGSDGPGVDARGSVSMPIVDGSLAVRLSGFRQHEAGYIDNVGTGVAHANSFSREGGRVTLLWVPVSNLTLEATYLEQQMAQADATGVSVDPVTLEPVYGHQARFTNMSEPFYDRVRFAYVNLNWDMGFASLTNAASWSRHYTTDDFDLGNGLNQCCDPSNPNGFSAFDGFYNTSKYTDELRLASRSDRRITWLLGVYVTKEDSYFNYNFNSYTPDKVLFPPIGRFESLVEPGVYKEWATFGDITFKLTDSFDITGGARYASNENSACKLVDSGIFGGGPAPCQTRPYQSKVTWLSTASYHLDPNTMLYARIATGYRPGGGCSACGNASEGVPAFFYSDSIVDYELGLKGQFFDRRLQLDASAFFIDWKNMQIIAVSPEGFSYQGNAGGSHSSGLELSSVYQATRELQLTATLAYTDAHLIADLPSATPGLFVGRNGDPLAVSPRWTASLIVNYTRPITPSDTFLLGGDYRYRDVAFNGYASATDPLDPALPMGPQNIFGLYTGIRLNQTTVRLYGLNVFNNRSYTGLLYLQDPAHPTMNPVQPRTIGLSIEYQFR